MKPAANNSSVNSPLKPAASRVDPQQISLRAHQLYVQRGRVHGHDLKDWLQAETEIGRPRDAPLPVARIAA
jgi:hypothetical protein